MLLELISAIKKYRCILLAPKKISRQDAVNTVSEQQIFVYEQDAQKNITTFAKKTKCIKIRLK